MESINNMRAVDFRGVAVFAIIALTMILGKALDNKKQIVEQSIEQSTVQSIEQSTVQSNLLEDEIYIHFYEENPGKEDMKRVETVEGTVISIDGMKISIKTQDGLIERSSKFLYNTTTERGYIVIRKE